MEMFQFSESQVSRATCPGPELGEEMGRGPHISLVCRGTLVLESEPWGHQETACLLSPGEEETAQGGEAWGRGEDGMGRETGGKTFTLFSQINTQILLNVHSVRHLERSHVQHKDA